MWKLYITRLSFCWNLSEHVVANVIPLTRPTEIFERRKRTAVHADQFVLFDRFFLERRITATRRVFWRRAHNDLTNESH